ncbi:MAG: hypothetical protein KMY55_04970 [Dethiosulfatibacter sp.]|nr:hypothetical protein [Dethiosulfatibacter sp.]
MKKALMFLAIMILTFLTACGNNTENPLHENLIILDAGEWSQNEYTANIPESEWGEFLRGWIDPEQEFFYLELSNISQDESEQYIQKMKKTGFIIVEEVSEEINNEYISVGILLANDDTSVNLSYFDSFLMMYIKNEN